MSDGKQLALLLRGVLALPLVREALSDLDLQADLRALSLAQETPIPLKEAAALAGTTASTVRSWVKRDAVFAGSGIVFKKTNGYWFAAPAALRRWVEEHIGTREPRGPAPPPRRSTAEVLN